MGHRGPEKQSSVLCALNFLSVQLTLCVCFSRNLLCVVKEDGSGERKPLIFMGRLSDLPSRRQVEVPGLAPKSLVPKLLHIFKIFFPTLFPKPWSRKSISFLQHLPSLRVEPFQSEWQASWPFSTQEEQGLLLPKPNTYHTQKCHTDGIHPISRAPNH